MQELDNIIQTYLKMDTNYALMITGEWGIGKTFYFKNDLQEKINSTPVYSDNAKKYKSIVISLFGLKSIDEIQTEILLGIYPFFKNKKVKLAINVGKALIKGFMRLKQLGDYYDIVSDVEIEKEDWIKFQQLVICFDDLERISKELNLEELIGFINSLVENENIKIVIIANEGKIEEKTYASLKEKVVGNTIEFIPDINKVYESIIEKKFSSYPSYVSFLKEQKHFVSEAFLKHSQNLRVLIFAFSYYQLIYSNLEMHLFEEDTLKEIESRILLDTLRFTLAIALEYKTGNISFKKNQGINESRDLSLDALMHKVWRVESIKVKKTEEKTYAQLFIEKYYNEKSYIFLNTVYNYITGGASLNYRILIDELKTIYHIESNKILPQFELLDRLSFQRTFNLTNKEYLSKTRELLKFAFNGNFNLNNYMTVFFYAKRFENPLRLNKTLLTKRILNGMKKGIPLYQYNQLLSHELRYDVADPDESEYSKIRDEALKINEQLAKKEKVAKSESMERSCYENFENFKEQLLQKDEAWRYKPVFTNFNANKFYSFYLNSESERQWDIVKLFFIKLEWVNHDHKPELSFYKKLILRVSKKNDRYKGVNITGFFWEEFYKVLKGIIEKLS